MSMGAQQTGTQTTTNLPPQYMYPYIGTGLNQATSILGKGTPAYYPGNTVAGFSPVQQDAMRAGINLDKNLMQGSGNPYEDAMFNHAAEMTQNQLASEFAGAGRNVSESAPLRAEQLNNLATGFYGDQYQNDVNNAMNASNNRLGIGGMVQNQAQKLIDANVNKYNYYQQGPQRSLTQYLQSIGAVQPGSAQNSPIYTNPAANVAGLASIFASIASMFG